MPTRRYLAVRAPGVLMHGGSEGVWARQSVFGRSWSPVQFRWELQGSKVDAGPKFLRQLRTNQQGNFDFHYLHLQTAPLAAQTLTAGQTLTIAFFVRCRWDDRALGLTNDATARYKVHAYLANGQTTAVKTVLAANQIGGINFPGTSGSEWREFSVTLAGATVALGDIIIIEIGPRILTSPTPAPLYPPADSTRIDWGYTGTISGNADGTDGSTDSTLNAWVEFSQVLSFAALPAPPANDACADAIDITAALTAGRYDSGIFDVSQSADTQRAVWWTLTPAITGRLMLATYGANYAADIDVFTGSCGALVTAGFQVQRTGLWEHRSACSVVLDPVTQGVQIFIRVQSVAVATSAAEQAGVCRLQAFYQDTTPVVDDLYLPAGDLVQLRAGVLVNFSAAWQPSGPVTGIAIDYTRRPMDDLNTGGINTNERILLGLHDFELVEILNLPDLSYGQWPFQLEVGFIGDPWRVGGINIHPAQVYVTAGGRLYAAWFGNGYLFVVGFGVTFPTILDTVSDVASHSALKSIDATSGDLQTGAPFTDQEQFPAIEVTAPWGITLDERTSVLYYVSGGFYEPVGGQLIKRFNVLTDTQLADFATVPLQAGNNPGIKGLRVLPNGDVLICTSTVVHRLNTSGAIVQTYTPSIALDSQDLVDVVLTADGLRFWVIDLQTTRLFQFVIATGVETQTVQPYLNGGGLVQMAIYQPDGVAAAGALPPAACPIPQPTIV